MRGDFVLNAGSSVETIGVANTARYTGLLIGGNELAQSIVGGSGADTLNSGGGADTLSGGLGDDTYRLFGGETINEAFGGGDNRVFTSGSFVAPQYVRLPQLYSGSEVSFPNEIEFISTAFNAGTEAINLAGSPIAQTIIGNYGNNILDGQRGRDTLIGLRGDDIYHVYNSSEVIIETAGEGNDAVLSDNNYILASGVSVETLSTAANRYTDAVNLTGNEIAQTVVGNNGVNILDGGDGNDTLIGLQGNDIFTFTISPNSGNIDTLPDFGIGADRLRLDPAIFVGLTAGMLPASAITIGSTALDADDRVIYNSATGALSFDSDGTGDAAAVQFAVLPTGLAASQIVVDVLDRTSSSGVVVIPDSLITLLTGEAIGSGVDLRSTYPNATSFRIGDGSLSGAAPTIVFGPNSFQEPITFRWGLSVGVFDFSQIGTGLKLTPTTDFQTVAGRTIIAFPNYMDFGLAGERPSAIIGTPYVDYIDASRRPGAGGDDLRVGPNLSGGAGNDTLIGGFLMDGGSGDDLLIATNNSVLVGGIGSDTFRIGVNVRYLGYQRAPNTLLDFNPTEDKIELLVTREPFLSLFSTGPLSDGQFTTEPKTNYGSVGTVFYEASSGYLYSWDTDIGGFGLSIFARLPAHLDLTAANFTVVGP